MLIRGITTTDGVNLSLHDQGAGRPVVLLPGYGAAARSWTLQVRELQDHYRVISVDRRNHGNADRPTHGQRMSRHATDVHEILVALDLQDVLLVGSSMGSNIALAYIDSYGCNRLGGVVLVDQTPKMVNDDDWELGFYGLTWGNADAWIQAFPDGVGAFHTQPSMDVLASTLDGPPFSIDQTRALLRDHTLADWRDVLPRITVPVTAMAGRHSPVWPWESAQWMANASPQGELVVFEQSGHAPMLEEPAAFNAALLSAASR